MGSIAGDRAPRIFDISYRYRFFIEIDPADPWRIARLAIELCDADGHNLLLKEVPEPAADDADPDDEESARAADQADPKADDDEYGWDDDEYLDDDALDAEEARTLKKLMAAEGIPTDTLADIENAYAAAPDGFWDPRCDEQPPLHPAVSAPRRG